jgi:hypothetical protein
MSASDNQTSAPRPNAYERRVRIVERLSEAVDAASQRLCDAARGEAAMSEPQLKAVLAIIKLLPEVLENLPKQPSPPPYQTPLIPRCEICGAGPGAHWPDRCPGNPAQRRF